MSPLEYLPAGPALLLIAAAAGAAGGMEGHDLHAYLAAERLEYQARDGRDLASWDAEAWFGGDLHKAWLKTEGEYVRDRDLERAELQLLYSRAIGAYWDLQAGLRHDFEPGPSTGYGVVGLRGTAPFHIEVDLAGFLSEDGDAAARAELEYDLLITQRLVLQPRMELDAAFASVPERGIGRGVTALEAGLRLRYELRREFAPYLGVSYARRYGDSADFARAAGERSETWSAVAGLRVWF